MRVGLLGLLVGLAVCFVQSSAFAQRGRPAAPAPASSPARGWSNPDALALAKEGIEAKKNGDLATCIAKDQASLALEEHPYVKLHISSCYVGQRRYKDALVFARDALAAAIRSEDDDLKKAALARVQEIMPRLSYLKIEIPEKTENLKISLNGQPLQPRQIRDRLTVDPGEYTVEASKVEKGDRYFFKDTVTLAEGEDKSIEVLPKKDQLPGEVETCLREAKSYRERLKCIEEPTTHPNVHVGIEISGYTDTTAVNVFTPAINAAVVSPTGGWNVGGSYLLDVVSAASPDLVATASQPFHERRHAGSLGGGYKFGNVSVQAHGNVSSEPDYLSRTLGAAASTELNEKLITPRLGYNFTWDTIGYRDTAFANFNRPLVTHQIEAGVTFVVSPTTLLVTGLSFQAERGENAKLYRFVPMFPESIAGNVEAGSAASLVNDVRLNVRPREMVPDSRDRIAIGARMNRRYPFGTLRVEQRFYSDNWGIKASTTDGRLMHDLSDRLRVWPHGRLHVQTGASFYELAYAAKTEPLDIPQYRIADREASPMLGLTIGGGARLALTSEKASTQYALVGSMDLLYNRYFASLYILSRTALWGTVGFEADF